MTRMRRSRKDPTATLNILASLAVNDLQERRRERVWESRREKDRREGRGMKGQRNEKMKREGKKGGGGGGGEGKEW